MYGEWRREAHEIKIWNGEKEVARKVDLPTKCRICHDGMKPIPLTASFNNPALPGYKKFFVVVLCTACHEVLLCNYIDRGKEPIGWLSIYPQKSEQLEFTPLLDKVLPNYKSVLRQAERAYYEGLEDVAGAGYRKAMEFLVRDFIRYVTPHKAEKIKGTALGNCISQHLPAECAGLKSAAANCADLGNDFVHEIRKYEHRDIEHLKRLAHAAIHLFENYLLSMIPLQEQDNI